MELTDGRGPLRQTRELAAINRLLAEDAAGLRVLRRFAQGLAETSTAEHIDFQERRETLAAVHRVPPHVLRRLRPAVRQRAVAKRVRANALARDAAAWLWIELAGGVLHHSPHHAAARTRLRAFDQLLAPEDRLVLLEYGHDVLGSVTDDVARQHTSTPGRAAGSRADVG